MAKKGRDGADLRDTSHQNATDLDVSPNQLIAIESLISGKSMTAAAEAAGVNRATLWRWLHKDPDFQATLNSYKKDAVEQVQAQLAGLSTLAISAVKKALQAGDAKTGLALLRGLGALDGNRPEPPSDDVQELRLRLRRAESERLLAETCFLL